MPRPVVPMRALPERRSRAAGRGRGGAAGSAARSRRCSRLSRLTSTPWPRSASISASSAQGSSTTPLPMTDSLPGRTTPRGQQAELVGDAVDDQRVAGVVAALEADDDVGAARDSQSTILPLPSSPHWAPTTTTLAMTLSLLRRTAGSGRRPRPAVDKRWVQPSRRPPPADRRRDRARRWRPSRAGAARAPPPAACRRAAAGAPAAVAAGPAARHHEQGDQPTLIALRWTKPNGIRLNMKNWPN